MKLLAATETIAGLDPLWFKGGVLIFFFVFFLVVITRVFTTRQEIHDSCAQIPLTDDVLEPRPSASRSENRS